MRKVGKLGKVTRTSMDEELVQNVLMDRQFVKNFVMGANIDPQVVMDLFTFKIGGWNILQSSNRKLLEEGIEENDSQWYRSKYQAEIFLHDTELGTTTCV